MGGGEVPPGFPQANPTVSYWQLPPHAIANHRTTTSLPTATTFDYVIIGSGISGAAIAFKLLSREPSLSILMLEARTAASGASGRNGGHCRAGWWLNFKEYTANFGAEEALKFEQLEQQNVQDIADFVQRHKVECDFEEVETADTYSQLHVWEGVLHMLQTRNETIQKHPELNLPSKKEVWHGLATQAHLGLPYIVGAVTYSAYTLNPYLLVCRMLELGLEMGLNLQTNTMALAVKPASQSSGRSGGWEVHTDRGNVNTKQVILATNAYTNALHRGIADTGFLTPSRSQVTAIRPRDGLPDHHPIRTKSIGLNDRGSGDYFTTRAPGLKGEGDVLYGGGRSISKTREMGITDDSTVNKDIATYLKNAAPRTFGGETWGDHSVKIRDWSGITCYTPDTFPLVGEVPDEKGLWVSVGMNGHGMAMAFRSAEALVSMLTTGKEPEWFPKMFRIERAWAGKQTDLHFKGSL